MLKFSNKFLEIIHLQAKQGYKPKIAKVNHIVYWKKEDAEIEVKIVLPEVYFEQ